MTQGIDDFTIVLPELTDMAACELKVYEGLDRLAVQESQLSPDDADLSRTSYRKRSAPA